MAIFNIKTFKITNLSIFLTVYLLLFPSLYADNSKPDDSELENLIEEYNQVKEEESRILPQNNYVELSIN